MGERAFAREGDFEDCKKEYGLKTLMRYADQFRISKQEALALFAAIPFLNGGLFDCLDKEDERGHVVYVDGFSRNPKKRAYVPDLLFFMTEEQEVDLRSAYEKVVNIAPDEKQLVEIAKALTQKANILILDEPTDSPGFQQVQDLFTTTTALFISIDQMESTLKVISI